MEGLIGNVVIVPVFVIQISTTSKNEIKTNCRFNTKMEIIYCCSQIDKSERRDWA